MSGCSSSAARIRALEHHAALLSLFEILDVAGRADLKSELMQELERQKQTLSALRSNPADLRRGAQRDPERHRPSRRGFVSVLRQDRPGVCAKMTG